MKIPSPTRPATRPSAQGMNYFQVNANPDSFGASVGRALVGLGASVAQASQIANKTDNFEMNKLFIDEEKFAQQDLQTRKTAAELGATGFTDTLLDDYERRHRELMAEVQKRGWAPELLQDLDLKLANLRNNLQTNGLNFQYQSSLEKVTSDLSDVGVSVSQIVSMAPDDLPGALEQLSTAVNAAPIDAVQRSKLQAQLENQVKLAAGLAKARQQPQSVISMLNTNPAVAAEGDRAGYFAAIRKSESGGNDRAVNPKSTATGRYQFIEGTWQQLRQQFPDAGLTADGRTDPAQQEIAIRLFTKQNENYLTSHGVAATNANLYAAHFLGASAAVQVLKAPAETPLSTLLPNSVFAANQFARNMTVADFRQWTAKKAGGSSYTLTDGKTGDFVLDTLDAGQRAQVYATAQTALNHQQVTTKANLEVNVANASAALLTTGEFNGKLPVKDDFLRAYDPIEAEQKWAEFRGVVETGNFIADIKTLTSGEISQRLEASKPTNTASETYAADLEAYNNRAKAAQIVAEQRKQDPAAYISSAFPQIVEEENPTLRYSQMRMAYDKIGQPQSLRKPWSANQIVAERDRYNALSPEQKVQYLADLHGQLGNMFMNGLRQMADNGMETEAYLAGMVSLYPRGLSMAANVLRGMQIIAEDPARRPPPQQLQQNFYTFMSSALPYLDPRASSAMQKAATALYAFNGGDPVIVDTSAYEKALRAVVGGNPDDSSSGWYQFGNEITILPPGLTADEFRNTIEDFGENDLQILSETGEGPVYRNNQPVPLEDIIAEGEFLRVGPMSYIIKMQSDGLPLMTKTGEYYKIRIFGGDWDHGTTAGALLEGIDVGPENVEDNNALP